MEDQKTKVIVQQWIGMREEFRSHIDNQFKNHIQYLPRESTVGSVKVMDRNTIVALDVHNSAERKFDFMEDVLNCRNNVQNQIELIDHSSSEVKHYLHKLVVYPGSELDLGNIPVEKLYKVGNIFLYTISNFPVEDLIVASITQSWKNAFIMYHNNEIFRIMARHLPDFDPIVEELKLATDDQLEEHVKEFRQGVDQRIAATRRKLLYTGVGIVGSIALNSMGLPPIGGLLVKYLTPDEGLPSIDDDGFIDQINDDGTEESRNAWRSLLKKIYNFIKERFSK